MPKLIVSEVSIDKLQEDPDNARIHSRRLIDVVKASLEEFGQVEPLVVHEGIVIGGNGRLKGMRELGWKKVSVHEFKGTKNQAIALALTLNRSAQFAEWDLDQLQTSLDLIEVDMSSLFNENELNSLFPGDPDDPEKEWEGMPEFENEEAGAYRSLIIHFENQENLEDFQSRIGQVLSDKTKYIWHPKQVRADLKSLACNDTSLPDICPD